MKKILLIIALFVNSIFANAQWVDVEVPVGRVGSIKYAINGCVFLSKDSVVVWDMASAYLSTNRGINFEKWPNIGFAGAQFVSKVGENKFRIGKGGAVFNLLTTMEIHGNLFL